MSEQNELELTVSSTRSDQTIAKIAVMDSSVLLTFGGRTEFRVLKGFGALWQRSFDGKSITVKYQNQFVILRFLAFPVERAGTGYLEVDSIAAELAEPVAPAQPEPSTRRSKKRNSSRRTTAASPVQRIRRLILG